MTDYMGTSGDDSSPVFTPGDAPFTWHAGLGDDTLNFDSTEDPLPLIETEVADGNGGFDLEIIQDGNNSYAYNIEHASLIGGDGDDVFNSDFG